MQNSDKRHLAKLQDYYGRFGVLPSYADISRLVGFRAKTAAVKLAERLVAAGYVRKAPNGRLAPDSKFFERKLATSSVRAGFPEMVDDAAPEPITLDRYLIDDPSRTILVPVKGDSMKGAGIFDGDVAVVESVERAEKGDFVVANVDGEFTLKELDFEDETLVLRAHNSAFAPIKGPSDIKIVGILKGLVRRYGRGPHQKKKMLGERIL